MQKIKLLCFSHAGSSSTVFLRWEKLFLSKNIEIVPVELPGRGSRLEEELCYEIEKIIPDLFIKHKTIIESGNYVVFGHSMGSLVLYEFCKYCITKDMPAPIHIFISGKEAPHICEREKISHLDDADFMKKVFELGGCDDELINNLEILTIFLPIIRNDYILVEKYRTKEITCFKCGLTVLNGIQDSISYGDLYGWKFYTDSDFEIINFEGGHFYLFDYPEKIARIVSDRIFMPKKKVL